MTSVENKNWTILELIETSTNYLIQKNIDDARLSVEIILSHTLNYPRIKLYSDFDKYISNSDLNNFRSKFTSLLKNEPLQYIVGETAFYGIKIKCDKRALIPRSETESIVESTIEFIKINYPANKEISILDIGTGTGCISIALTSKLENVKIIAIDNDEDAIALAIENVKNNSFEDKIELQKINFDEFVNNSSSKFDIIVCNPPYISLKDYNDLPAHIRQFEPRNALTDDSDGLLFYQKLLKHSSAKLKQNGALIIEHAFNQSEKIIEMFKNQNWDCESVIVDLSKNKRGAILRPIE
ncbi:MAG: peptide chain release factor N(5)-glutamine methyltransferase [Bacteroidetes bacterium]|nr:peptide chain release factor N(5)-glutamine methyltransferase [Bacteroidota bacterium]